MNTFRLLADRLRPAVTLSLGCRLDLRSDPEKDNARYQRLLKLAAAKATTLTIKEEKA